MAIERTNFVKAIERVHGDRPIEEIVREALDKHDKLPEAAEFIGCSVPTLRVWKAGLPGVESKTVAA